jgi:hypothetical protein
MKIELDKFVGRNQLPSDKVAFDRVSRAFAPRPPAPASAPRKQATRSVSPTLPTRKAA